MKVRLAAALLCAACVCRAQDRDFLSPNEVAQIREAQDPNERLTLYVGFARQRIDLIQNYLAKDKPGRSVFVRNYLDDYTHIIESIDTVSDDALKHHKPLDKGTLAVLNAEKGFLETLTKIQDSNPKDLDRYKFLLTEAIDTTSDSHELSMEDSNKRSGELTAEEAKEKKDREAMMPAKEVKGRHTEAAAEEDKKEQKKIPSLYRPGEKPQQPPQ
ncbi:MAG TPA: hypothetical protein VGG97_17600 [Bryobacteraceae bacterium]|jgi:hypothetical protein